MEAWATLASQLLVRTALAAIPLALVIAALCRWMPSRPATRHTLWLVLVAWFLVSPMLPGLPLWNLLATKLSADNASTVSEPIAANLPDEPNSDDPVTIAPDDESAANGGNTDDGQIASVESEEPRTASLLSRLANRASTSIRDSLTEWSHRVIAAIPGVKLETDSVADVSDPDDPIDAFAVDPKVADTPTNIAPSTSRWSEWTAWLLVVRDAITRLPTLPPAIVFGGIALLFCGHGLRTLFFYRKLRTKIKTPPSVNSLVQRCAKRIGLARTPIVQMTPENVSPMIWCGWRTRLILPAPLWLQLDNVGREAIVCHELAHLRRRDHWWCWGDLLAGTLYWWHPLVWWVRRRLHEEAELSCDAWVIWLLPHGRRAYAEALLRTNETVGRAFPVGPAVGMAVANGRTRQFARRLTMVMTHSTRPRMSFAGLSLAALIAAAGWAAVPARSCPPESGEKEAQTITAVEVTEATEAPEATATTVNLVVAPPGALPVGVITTATACPPGETAPEAKGMRTGVSNMSAGGRNLGITGGMGGGMGVAPRAARAMSTRAGQGGGQGGAWGAGQGAGWGPGGPDRIAQLERQVEELRARVEELSSRVGRGRRDASPRAAMAPRAPEMPGIPTPPREPMKPRMAMPPRVPMPPMPPQALAIPGEPAPMSAPQARGNSSPEAVVTRTYKLPKGKLDPMWDLMSRSDVPTTVRSIKGGIEVTATQSQHEVFEAFIRLIDPQGGPKPRANATPRAAAEMAQVEAAAQARATALRERLRATEERARAAATQRRNTQQDREKHLEQMLKHAEELRRHAESMRSQADDVKNGDEGESHAKALLDNAKNVEQQAKTLEQQMKELERQARELEKSGDILEQETEALGCLRDTFSEIKPANLAKLLTEASKLKHDADALTLPASLDEPLSALSSELTAKIEKALESLDVGGDLGQLTRHAKALEKLCDTLREKANEIDAADEAEPEDAAEAEASSAGR